MRVADVVVANVLQLGPFRFRLPATCFLQVHPAMAGVLSGIVADCAGDVDGRSALDLYGGIGVHGLELARRLPEV